jgi:outer membrane protein with beta-barrel domain
MKLRYLATVVLLAMTTVAAHAQSDNQVGLYFNPIAIRVSNSVLDSGPYNYFSPGSTSQVLWGFDFGGYYEFFHSGSIDAGLDVRESDLHTNNALLKSFLIGARASAHPFSRPFKPYLQASIGLGTTKSPLSTVHISKVDYGIFGGVDYTLQRHVDYRIVEIGYGSLTTSSSATIGGGGNIAIPPSKLLSFSTGFVFRF